MSTDKAKLSLKSKYLPRACQSKQVCRSRKDFDSFDFFFLASLDLESISFFVLTAASEIKRVVFFLFCSSYLLKDRFSLLEANVIDNNILSFVTFKIPVDSFIINISNMTSDAAEKDSKKSGDTKATTGPSKDLVDKLQSVAKPLLNVLYIAIPLCIKFGRKIHGFWIKCDDNVIAVFIGFVFCFFGGLYPTLFSAIQAAEQGGRAVLVASLKDLADEAVVIMEQSKKDDKVDADKDGVADVEQIENKEYVQRKTLLVLQKMNPQKGGHRLVYYLHRLVVCHGCPIHSICQNDSNGKFNC